MAEEILKKDGIYFGEETLGSIPCTIGSTKKSKWNWLGMQLNTFVFIEETGASIGKQLIQTYSADCYTYSLNYHKYWPRAAICC